MRSLEHAAAGLERVVNRSLRQAAPSDAPLLAWPLACGKTVAEKTRALDFKDGLLRVQVPDASWRAELRSLASHYLAIINRRVQRPVERIEFIVIGKAPSRSERSIR